MQLHSHSFSDNGPIPVRNAFGKPGAPVDLADNRNPQLTWTDAPHGTCSFVLTCVDPDAPSRHDDVNRPGCRVPVDLPRMVFVHWLMANIPPECDGLVEGACSDRVTPRGKREPDGPDGSIQGRNDYSRFFANDDAMSGLYLGYDGPCPPWNDCLVHRYDFRIHALDVAALDLRPGFTLNELDTAMTGHVLAEARWRGTYTLNPDLRKR